MPGLVPGIHALEHNQTKDVDGRDKPGHDAAESHATGDNPPSTLVAVPVMKPA